MEPADELKARIEDASRYVPLERLALSTQCGFASNCARQRDSMESQRAKLELVIDVARDMWQAHDGAAQWSRGRSRRLARMIVPG